MSIFSKLKGLFSGKSGDKKPGTDPKRSADVAGTALRTSLRTQIGSPSHDPTVLQTKERPHLEDWAGKQLKVWKEGDVILDVYTVEEVKAGGMGYVYIAEHKDWDVKMAIKSPNEMMLSNKGLFDRVLKEANSWIELGLHPHIAYCYYVRRIEDMPHIFIEYVDGGNLREWIIDKRCQDLKVGLDMAIQICHGMEHAHKIGRAHV